MDDSSIVEGNKTGLSGTEATDGVSGKRSRKRFHESYYARNAERRREYQRRYNADNRPVGSRKRKASPVPHTHSPVFFRFGMDVEPVVRTASGDKPIYSNQWVCLNSKDSDRTEDMLFEETTLALDLHFVQLEQIRKHGTDDWTHGYLVELKKMVDDECKATSRLRRRALDLGNPPAYIVRLHRHRRHIACLRQEMDLIEQAVNYTVNNGDVLDVCLYLKHAIQTGSAIITGACVNIKYFEHVYGF